DELVGQHIGRGKHGWHEVTLLRAYAVLAGEAASMRHAGAQDIARHLLGRLLRSRRALVIEHEWMEGAIAGVEDVGHSQATRLTHRLDLAQDRRKPCARNDAVLHDIVWADAPDRRERSLAPLPHQCPLFVGTGQAQFLGTALAAD